MGVEMLVMFLSEFIITINKYFLSLLCAWQYGNNDQLTDHHLDVQCFKLSFSDLCSLLYLCPGSSVLTSCSVVLPYPANYVTISTWR